MSPLEELEQLMNKVPMDAMTTAQVWLALKEAIESRDTEDGDNWLSAYVLLDSIKEWLMIDD